MDPIERDDFHPRRPRPVNEERIKKIGYYASRKRHYEDLLTMEIREARAAGHSYRQLADAAEVSISTIQRMVEG